MFRIHFATAAFAAAVAIAPLQAQQRVPAALDNLKPHEIVEAISSEATALRLAPDQVRRLDSLHVAVRDERHQWIATSGNKAHAMLKMKPMISADHAYNDAVAILTPDQRAALARVLADSSYVPAVPSLATQVPPSLGGLKPHEIPQVFVAERKQLGLSDEQVTQLQALHVAVRDEGHRYVQRQHGAKGHPHMMMEPMISKRRAYNDALSYLTAEQQKAADRLFRGSTFKPRLGTGTN